MVFSSECLPNLSNRQAREVRKENSLNFAILAFFAVIFFRVMQAPPTLRKPWGAPYGRSMAFPKSLDKPAGLERECHELANFANFLGFIRVIR